MDIEIDQSEFMLLFNHIYLHPFHLTEDVTELVDQVHNLFYNICFSGRRRFRQCRLSEPVGRRKPERRGVQPRPILLDSRKKKKKMKKCIFFVFWNCEEKLVNYKFFLLLKCRLLFCFCRQNSSTDVETMKRRIDLATF